MKKTVLSIILAGAVFLPFAAAEGGGGIEYGTNLGSDVFGKVPLPGGTWMDLPSGSLEVWGGFGYGVSHGWKTGGFGFAITGHDLGIYLPSQNIILKDLGGGFGGLISGGQARLGPFVFAINGRIGAGGIGASYLALDGDWTRSGFAALYGSLDAEAGIRVFRWLLLSAYGGAQALFPFPLQRADPVIFAPTAGIRVTWGSF